MDSKLDFKQIGYRIQYYRLENKLTQEELAEKVGTTQKHLSRIEGGYHRSSFDTIIEITRALHIPVDALIADAQNSKDESNLKLILDDIRGMSPNQLAMLKENIETIKKYGK